MLLLVVHAQFNPPQRLCFRTRLQQPLNSLIHMLSVTQNLIQPRPRKHSPQSLLRKRRKPLVIAVEQPWKILIEQPISRQELPQHKRLEKPCRMRQVPFGWRGLRARLHHHVLRRQPRAQRKRPQPRRAKPNSQLHLRAIRSRRPHRVPLQHFKRVYPEPSAFLPLDLRPAKRILHCSARRRLHLVV